MAMKLMPMVSSIVKLNLRKLLVYHDIINNEHPIEDGVNLMRGRDGVLPEGCFCTCRLAFKGRLYFL